MDSAPKCNSEATLSKHKSRFADVYGMCSEDVMRHAPISGQRDFLDNEDAQFSHPSYVNIVYQGPENAYYKSRKSFDIRTIIGVFLIIAAVISAVLIAIIPLYLLFNLIMLENQTELAYITKVKKIPFISLSKKSDEND